MFQLTLNVPVGPPPPAIVTVEEPDPDVVGVPTTRYPEYHSKKKIDSKNSLQRAKERPAGKAGFGVAVQTE